MIRTVVITAYEAHPSGATEAGLAWHWGMAYLRKGFEVIVLTQRTSNSELERLDWEAAGFIVHFLGVAQETKIPSRPLDFIRRQRSYSKWLRNSRLVLIDHDDDLSLIHHVSWGSVRLSRPSNNLKRAITVWGPLGGGQFPELRGLTKSSIPLELTRLLTFAPAFCLRLFDEIKSKDSPIVLATNLSTKNFLTLSFAKNVHLELADGVSAKNADEIKIRHPQEVKQLIWLGRFVPSKRPDLAVKALAKLISRGLECELTMLGDGPEMSNVRKLVSELKVESRVKILGRVPPDAVSAFYQNCDVNLFMSMRDSSCPTVLEAAQHGKPSFGLRRSGFLDLIPTPIGNGPTEYRSEGQFVSELVELVYSHLSMHHQQITEVSYVCSKFAKTQFWDSKVSRILEIVKNSQ